MDTNKIILIYLIILLVIGMVGAYLMLRRTKKEKMRELDNKEWTERVGTSEYEIQAISDLKKQAVKKGMAYFIPFLFSIVAILLGKLWEWWYKPLKIVMTFVIAGLAAAVILFLAWDTSHGKIFITVRGANYLHYPQLLNGIKVKIEARDKTTNQKDKVNALTFEYKEGIEPISGFVELNSNSDGVAFSNFNGRYTDSNIIFRIIISPDEKDIAQSMFVQDSVELSYRDLVEHTFILKRKETPITGSFPLSIKIGSSPEVNKLFPPGGGERPKLYNLEIYCIDKNDQPNITAKFYLKNKPDEKGEVFKPTTPGNFIFEKLEVDKPFIVDYSVTDSSKLQMNVKFTDDYKPTGNNKLEFPPFPKIQVIKDASKGNKALPVSLLPPSVNVVSTGKTDTIYYKFEVFDQNEYRFKNGHIIFKTSKGNITKDTALTSEEIKFPDFSITREDEFWNNAGSIIVTIKDADKSEKSETVRITRNNIPSNRIIKLHYHTKKNKLELK
jgi:hypothetical protein